MTASDDVNAFLHSEEGAGAEAPAESPVAPEVLAGLVEPGPVREARDLMPGHRRELEASRIGETVITTRGYETLYGTDEDRLRLRDLHVPRWSWREDLAYPGILMPMYRVTGEEIGAQWKPAIPQEAPGGRMEKYASQAGVPNRLDVPPSVSAAVRDPSNPLWITEGIKKGDCLASLGRAVITLTGVFNWRSKMGTLGDWEDVPLRNRSVVICFDSDARSNRNVMLAMARLGRWLESKGASDVRYLIVPEEVDGAHVKGVDDYFAAGGTMERLRDAALAQLPSEARDATFTDPVLAESVCSEELDEGYRWAPGVGWMEWSGKVWTESNEVAVTEAVRQWVLGQYHQAADRVNTTAGSAAQASVAGWFGVLSAGRIGSVVRLAKGILAIPADAFDGNPDLLNCTNGIVDLRTGQLQPHDPDLLMTKITEADFVKNAQHDDWDKALNALPDDVRDWYQLRVGQALTGHMTPDDMVIICQGGGANGKALDVATPMLTANRGWTTMGDLWEGDEVYGPDGQPAKVTGAYDVLHGRTCYRVTMSDGRSVVADAGHLWTVRLNKGTSKLNLPRWVDMTTQQMLDRGVVARSRGGQKEYRFRLPGQSAVQSPAVDLPFDPYVLGAWLGDGHSAGSRITIHPDDVEIIDNIRAAGVPVRKQSGRYGWAMGPGRSVCKGESVTEQLRSLGVLGNKHIPEQYLAAGIEQRLALVQGLMDTDGFASAGQGQAEFCSTSRALADGMLYLVRSLGWKASLKESDATLNGRVIGSKYRVMWTPGPDGMIPFRLARKADRIQASRSRVMTSAPSVVSIEQVDTRPVRCITVDREDALYLAGRDLIPTHNSTVYDSLALAAGKYHVQVSDRAMLGGASDNHPTEIMDLMGARYAVLEETPESRRLDTNRLKKLSGTREITGRRIRQDPVTFAATHTLFINSNYRPVVDETDHGTWRRLALLKWPFTFRKSQDACYGPNDRVGDATLRDRLKLDPRALEAALAWMAAGARRWYEFEKIMPELPQRVTDDTLEWRKEADLVLAFAPDEIEFDRERYVIASELRAVFNEKLRERGQREWSEKTFAARFGGHDLVAQHGVVYKVVKKTAALSTRQVSPPTASTFRAWVGIKFRDNSGPSDETGNSGNDLFGGGGDKPVTPVTRSGITIPAPVRACVNDSGVTGVTGAVIRIEEQDQSDGEPMIEINPDDLVDPFAEEPAPVPPEGVGAVAPGAPLPLPQTPVPGRERSLSAFDVSGDVGFDLETGAAEELFTHGPEFTRIGGLINERGETVTTDDIATLVEKINEADSVYGHNILGFDGLALAYWHGMDWDAFCAKATDTDPLSRAAFPPRSRTHGSADAYDLNHVAERYGVVGKTDDLARLKRIHGGYDQIPKADPDYNSYLVGDVRASQHIRKVLPENDYTQREHTIAAMMGRMTLNGFKVDRELLHERYTEGQAKKKAAEERLSDEFGLPLGREVTKGRGSAKHAEFEMFSSPLATTEGGAWLKELWGTYGVTRPPRTQKGALSTKAVEMEKISQHPKCPPELKAILGLMGIVTTTRTVYATAMKFLAADGRVHPFVSMKQASGRASITNPGMTVYGKHDGKHVERAIFVPDEGEVLITCDASQVDMRAIAGHCQDQAYMALFEPGRDAHQEIANLLGISRQDAKARGHGWNYGLGANAMIRDGADPEIVYAFVNGMQERFPGLIEWREEIREKGGRGELLDNGFGRMMRCDPQQAYTVAPALMGQGGARDLVCDALLRLPREYWPYLRTFVHDEIVMSVPEDRAEEIMGTVKDAFTTVWKGVPILADTTGPAGDWGSASEK
jgi:phage/plasmid-associated DNA primase